MEFSAMALGTSLRLTRPGISAPRRMPLRTRRTPRPSGKERVGGARIGELDVQQPNLRDRIPRHRSPKGPGQELGPEADPQDGQTTQRRLPDGGRLGDEPGETSVLVHVHGAAEDEQRIRSGQRGNRVALVQLDGGHLGAVFVQEPTPDSWVLAG